jgi:hypothetical protein
VSELLRAHVERFNTGVRTGDWASMLEQFGDDAELRFEGIPVGPFVGKDAIASGYAAQPPDDEIDVLSEDDRGAEIVAVYAWRREGRAAGRLILTVREGLIERLVVTFEEV